MINTVLLDLDGVLVDFVKGLHDVLALSYDPLAYPYTPGNYDLFSDIAARTKDRTRAHLYQICQSSQFWAGLPWAPAAHDILDIVSLHFTKSKIYVCTSPMQHPDAWAGKVMWIQRHLSKRVAGTIITSAPKHLLAKPGTALLDDKDSNVREFRDHGGAAFLIPQPWNDARHALTCDYWLSDLTKFLIQP
jgi:5'(3')-deoxyribonucleotidase